MKDSKIYAGNVQKYFRSAKRKQGKVSKVRYENILESVVYGALLEHLSESEVASAMRKFDNHFVDFNDLRVSRPEEIIEMIGKDTDQSRKAASALIQVLRSIFRRYNSLDLAFLKKAGKRQARVNLEKIEPMTAFCVDYCMLTALSGHSIPLTEKMIKYLRENKLVYKTADYADIEGFLTRQIPAAKGYDFYALLRKDSERASKKTTKKKKKTKKVSKKTAKKKK